ncbi:MAG: hypothetical protein GYB68_01100 [Chloroflexi bacterium]|nr:hypothetical protein [Chloroflexota bacterium]
MASPAEFRCANCRAPIPSEAINWTTGLITCPYCGSIFALPVDLRKALPAPYASLVENRKVEPCKWHIGIELGHFAANQTISVNSQYTELRCESGELVHSGWSAEWGQSDENGAFRFGVVHVGTGYYHYTFSDETGNQAEFHLRTTDD